SLGHALRLERGDACRRDLAHLVERAEFDRLRRTRGGAGRFEIVLERVVGEGALWRGAGVVVEADDAVGARRDAVAAAIADVLLDEDRVELRTDDGVRGADFQAAGVGTVFANVRHHRPGDRLVGTLGRL